MTENITTAQMSVLGSILLDSKRSMRICVDNEVEASMFWDEAKKIYEVSLARYSENKITDLATVGDELANVAAECVDNTPTVAHLEYYIEELKKEYMHFQAVLLAMKTKDNMERGVDNIEEFIESTAKKWSGIIINEKEERDTADVGLDQIDKWQNPPPEMPTITWHLECLQKAIGYVTDDFMFLAAHPSVGKTSFALQWAVHLATKPEPVAVSIASLESGPGRIAPRFMSIIGSVNSWRLKNRLGTDSEYDDARAAMKQYKDLPIRISYNSMSAQQLKAWGQREKALGAQLLIVDNLRHIRESERNMGMVEKFTKNSMAMKELRDDTGLPTMVLHHLNKEDGMSWCSDAEKDADIILIMKEAPTKCIEASKNGPELWRVDLEINKNRDGQRYLNFYPQFIKQYGHWKDMAE